MIDKSILANYPIEKERLHAALPLLAPAIATAIGAALGLTGTGLVLRKKIQNYFANNPGALDSIASKFGTKPGDQPEVEEELKELSKPVGGKIETWEGSYADTGTKIPEKIPESKGIEVPPQEKVALPGFQKAEPLDTDILKKDIGKEKLTPTERMKEQGVEGDFSDYEYTGEETTNDLYRLEEEGVIKQDDWNVFSPRYDEYLDAQIVKRDKLYTWKEWENTPEAIKNKVRAELNPDWAEARFGDNWLEVLDKQRTSEIEQSIDPNFKEPLSSEQQLVRDIDEMNKANIDEIIRGRKKNASGGLVDKPLTGRSRDI